MNHFSALERRMLRRGRRGFASLIGLLLVLLIIMSLVQMGYFKKDPATGKTQAQFYEDKSKHAACLTDQAVLRGEIQQIMMGYNGRLPAANVLRARLVQFRCPDKKGVLQVDGQGNVYCTEHNPSPESESVSIINLYDPPPSAAHPVELPAK